MLFTIYRPPNTSHPAFISELSSLLEDLASSNSEVFITGDFNIHVDILSDPFSKSFSNLLETFDLKLHITFPTHNSGYTLDLLIIYEFVYFATRASQITMQFIYTINVQVHIWCDNKDYK